MKASIAVRSKLSGEAERLMRAWEQAVERLEPGDVGEVMLDFVAIVAERLRIRSTLAPRIRHRQPNGVTVELLEFPPFMELALREVIDAIGSDGPEHRKVERIVDMTTLLLGA